MNTSPCFHIFSSKKKRLIPAVLLLFFMGLNVSVLAQTMVVRQSVQPVASAVVNLKQAAALDKLRPRPVIAMPNFIPNEHEEDYQEPPGQIIPTEEAPVYYNRTAVVSPTPVLNYEGAPDAAQFGGPGFWTIPPDTYGAVGLDKVFTQLNNNYRILNKATGAELSLVSIETFWSSLGTDGTSVFDPRVTYDPYNNRWIIAAVSHGDDPASRVLLGISQTHDPEGNYNLYSFDPDGGALNWADFPMLGFNKNWIAIGINMFAIGAGSPPNLFYVIDYPALRGGTVTTTVFSGTSFCTHPAETYSSTEATLYAPNHLGSGGGTYQLNRITGTPAVPIFTGGAVMARTGGGWSILGAANVGPQNCTVSCPGTLVKLELPDAQIRNNVIFRNSAIWYTQSVGLPGGGFTRAAAQWTKLNTDGTFNDGGRIDDPTATAINGGRWYSYPSVAVNNSNDALVGFAKMESDGFAGAAYAMRLSGEAAGTMEDPVVYKDGTDYYEKDFGGGRNRWGDYSHTMIDPLDDASFWTIQEYAKTRTPPIVGGSDSKWGTWWAKVVPNACLSGVASGLWNVAGTWGCGGVPDATKHVSIVSGHNVTLNVDPLAASITINAGGTLTISTTRTLSCKLIVYGTLNITGGKLTLGTNDVFLAEGATLTGASSTSYFVTNSTGKLTKIIPGGGSFLFPVSPNTTSYNALTIATAGGNPDEVFSVRVDGSVTPSSSNNAACVQRTWNISEMTTGGNSATLTFRWAAAEHGSSYSPASAYAYRHNGSTYVLASGMTVPVLASGIYSSSTTIGISTFSPWIVAGSATLPVAMEYFTGTRLSNGSNKLDWKANCSGTNASFELQRSSDSRNFNNLSVTNADYNRCLQPFDYVDNNPFAGKNFYRVKMTDETGKITFSNIVLLLNSKSGFEIVNLLPNPVTSMAILNISVAARQELIILITDSKGSKVLQKNISTVAGSNQEELNLSSLASGTYLLSVVSASGDKRTMRFVKQ